MLIGPRALKSLNSIEKIQPRMMVATFNGNPSTTKFSCYSPTNVGEETDLIAFYNELSSLVRSILKHNVLVIGGDMNTQIGKNINHKFSLHNLSIRNGEHLTDFSLENRLTCFNKKFQKSEGKLWTYTQTTTTVHYDWSLLNNRDIRDKYTLTVRNKFDALQKTEIHTPNDEYENFVNAHLKAAAECIPTKQRAKPRVPWETLGVRKKCADMKTASKCNRKNPTNTMP